MKDTPQTPEAVALALTYQITNYERPSEDNRPDREYILSLYEECLKDVKGYPRGADT
jgi:hypothetical protein